MTAEALSSETVVLKYGNELFRIIIQYEGVNKKKKRMEDVID